MEPRGYGGHSKPAKRGFVSPGAAVALFVLLILIVIVVQVLYAKDPFVQFIEQDPNLNTMKKNFELQINYIYTEGQKVRSFGDVKTFGENLWKLL